MLSQPNSVIMNDHDEYKKKWKYKWLSVFNVQMHAKVFICEYTDTHDHVIKWKHFQRYWSFMRGIHRWTPLTKASDVKLWYFLWSAPGQSVDAGDMRRHRANYDVTVVGFENTKRVSNQQPLPALVISQWPLVTDMNWFEIPALTSYYIHYKL